jgi:uncharacterized membrane-anchored protein
MSFPRPHSSHRFISACLVTAMGLVSASSASVARDGRRYDHETDIPVLSAPTRRGFDEIVVQMAPLRPATGAVAAKPAPAPVAAQEAKPAPAPVVAQEAKPVVEAKQQAAAPKDAMKTEVAHVGDGGAGKAATLQPAQTAKGLDLRIGEAAMPLAPAAIAQSAKPADPVVAAAPSAPVAKQESKPSTPLVQQPPAPAAPGPKGLDLKIGEAAMPAAVVAQAAKPADPIAAAAPSAPVAKHESKPSTPLVQQPPAPAAQGLKGLDLKIGEAAMPAAVVAQVAKSADAVPAAPRSAPVAKQESKPAAAQDAKPQDAKPQDAKPVEAKPQDAKPVEAKPVEAAVAVSTPNAQGQTQAQTSETQAYAALLAQGVRGPVEVRLAGRATLWLPAGRVYLDGQQARKALGSAQGWDNAAQGVVLPTASRPDWMAYVSLIDDGYISDRDAKAMDPNSILGTFKAKVDADNPAREHQGLSMLEVTGWMEAPRYDAKHRLSACLRATLLGSKSPDDRFVNCSAFALGGQGAFKIVVVGQEADVERFKGEASALAETIAYDKGKGYEDADSATVKTAPYGLVALMTGGVDFNKITPARAMGTAKKPGLLGLVIVYLLKFGKMLLVGAAALFALAAVGRRIARKRKSSEGESSGDESSRDEAAQKQPSAAPIWQRAMEAARAKIASRGGKGALVAVSAETAEPRDLEMEAADEPDMEAPEPQSGLASTLANLRAKLPPRFVRRKASEAAPAAVAPAQRVSVAQPRAAAPSSEAAQSDESSAASLSRLASLMRKKALEPAVQVDLSRLERRAYRDAAAAPEVARPLDGAAPLAASKPDPAPTRAPAAIAAPAAPSAPALDSFALIEPGDEAAASMAISARESLRESNG